MSTASNVVESLLDAVKQFWPDELAQFTARLADWQESDGLNEAFLIQQTKLHLPIAESDRLRDLTAKGEQQELTAAEVEEFRGLTQRAERINVLRIRALAELARRREQPLRPIKKDVGWQEEQHGASENRPPPVGRRSRRFI